jgi:phosphoglycerol transferase MdoB-like AlkP superfamily enzyme
MNPTKNLLNRTASWMSRPRVIPLVSTTIFYSILRGPLLLRLGEETAYHILDFVLQVIIGYLLFCISKTTSKFLLIQLFLMYVLYVGHAVKNALLGGPITPDDVYSAMALLLYLKDVNILYVVIPLLILLGMIVTLCLNLKINATTTPLVFSVVAVFVGTLVFTPTVILNPLDHLFGNFPWDQRANYVKRGGTVYLIQETARYFMNRPTIPEPEMVHTATEEMSSDHTKPIKLINKIEPELKPRNIYIILLESFWDPKILKNAHLTGDPLSPEFRQLWEAGGPSWAMSPVFGGHTANSEFEVLCGHPSNLLEGVVFENGIKNDAPCLPALLSQHGYETIASHPNVPVFWNRMHAYRRLGFETHYSREDFELDDLNGPFLSDESLFRQVSDKMSGHSSENPKLNHILTISGHNSLSISDDRWFALNDKRPLIIKSNSAIEMIESYVNSIRYTSQEVVDFTEDILKDDPDAIIVITGDHLPILGENFAAYVESEILASSLSDFTTDMYFTLVRTPLIMIDGKNGPLNVGVINMYEIPHVILRLINFTESTPMDFFIPDDNLKVRVLEGQNLVVHPDHQAELCRSGLENDTCAYVKRWNENVKILSTDILLGSQHSLKPSPSPLNGPPVLHTAGMP